MTATAVAVIQMRNLWTHTSGSESSGDDKQQVATECSHTVATVVQSGDHVFMRNPASNKVRIAHQDVDRLFCRKTVLAGLKIDDHVDFSRTTLCLTCQRVAEGVLGNNWASRRSL